MPSFQSIIEIFMISFLTFGFNILLIYIIITWRRDLSLSNNINITLRHLTDLISYHIGRTFIGLDILKRSTKKGTSVIRKYYTEIPDRLERINKLPIIVIAVTLVSLIAAWNDVLQLDIPYYFQPKETMQGDFRIAIVPFSVDDDKKSDEIGVELAQSVYLKIAETIKRENLTFGITIWGPEKVREQIQGSTEVAREQAARKIANEIDANVVVYGIVNTTNDLDWIIQPAFYISESDSDVTEISGSHNFGGPFYVSSKGGLATRITTSKAFESRSILLSQIIVGLNYYVEHKYGEASEWFKSVERDTRWDEVKGKHILYLFLGNSYGHYGKIDLAQESFEKSLAIDKEYARAYVGIANVYYLLSLKQIDQEGNPTNIDMLLLEKAIDTYQRALNAKNQPPDSNIDVKVHFGLGEAYIVKSYIDKYTVSLANTEYQSVIDAYDMSRNGQIKELVAESHARLGLIDRQEGKIQDAVIHYKKAIELTVDQKRKDIFQKRIDALLEKT